MRAIPFALALLACPLLGPVAGQDSGEEEETKIDVSDGSAEEKAGEEPESEPNTAGLAGGKKDDGDEGAPKVESDLQKRINEAIERGVEWLKKKQGKNGSWGPCKANRVYGTQETGDFTRDPTGPTSFALFTLAKCGVPKNHGSVKRGLAWLRENAVTSDKSGKNKAISLTTYESASIVLMVEALHHRSKKLTGKHTSRRYVADNPLRPPDRSPIPAQDWLWMHDLIQHVTVGKTISGGGARGGGSTTTIPGCQNKGGGWRYGQANGDQDLSATQFVLLGLRAASQAGYPIEKTAPEVWKWSLAYLQSMQQSDGAFGYQKGNPWSAGMTAAGAASLIICKEQMQICGQEVPSWVDGAIEKALNHLDSVFDAGQNQGNHEGGSYHYYYLYGVERIGDLTGRKEFNAKDWYVRGAELLLAHQGADGEMSDGTCMEPRDTLGTCFALLFLKRATPPTVTASN
ncbi:MAG: hypothetical protein ACREID_06770 [Planctomycetota bacterium]